MKEYTIATDVFGRSSDFDQSTDAIVRVEMHRLRKKLKEFYAGEGAHQFVEIVIQSGNYSPEFLERRVGIAEWQREVEEKQRIEERLPIPVLPPVEPPVSLSKGPLFERWLMWLAGCLVLIGAGAAFFWGVRPKPTLPVGDTNFPSARDVAALGTAAPGAIRILSGRTLGQVRDREGNQWGPDAYFEGGTAVTVPVQPIYRTRNPVLFQGARSGEFSYKIPLAAGTHELHLYFADTAFVPGISMEGGENTRFFNVDLNGQRLLRNFDIIANSGPNTAYERVFKDVQPDKDGYLHLSFHKGIGEPLLNAIEILPGVPHRIRPVRLSTQDSGFTDKFGNNWQGDNYFLNGRSIAKYGIIAGPVDSQIYARERYGNFSYAIPAAAGKYRLNLHFAETYFGPGQQGGGGVGSRIFDVYCNGVVLLSHFDLFREAGVAHQFIKTFEGIQPNAQGNVLVSFVPSENYATVSALELIDESNQ
ncbi:MAG: hypothetical protein JO051_14450 [Acidobacteriaceae bacterium]|nr:hypothetical protein [Acidobacteriaceae bacterium]